MPTNPQVSRIVVDLRANTLILELEEPLLGEGSGEATIDIGTNGRLVGIEVADAWLPIAGDGGEPHLVRSAPVAVRFGPDRRSLTLPRRGHGWEISFPSGNQCWRLDNGRTICSIVNEPS